MRVWRFLRYEKPYLILYSVAFLLTASVFATDTESSWHWQTFFYALTLAALWLAAFLIHRYMRSTQAIRRVGHEDTEPISLEAEAYRDVLEQMEREQIRKLNEVQTRQKENHDFVVSWFHEIKTPISVLRLMQQTELDPRSLEEELSRIEHYVDQALYYAKLDSFHQDYEIAGCDLETLVKESVKANAKSFISKKIKILLDLTPTVVQSDAKWLAFILNQFLTNSLKYAGEGGEISVSTESAQKERLLTVRDDGIGIDPKDMPRIFNRGFTGSGGRSHGKSTGMGLYLAQEMARKLGHFITCESEQGCFTSFTLHFPRNNDPYLDVTK